jgi:hypothetical protein
MKTLHARIRLGLVVASLGAALGGANADVLSSQAPVPGGQAIVGTFSIPDDFGFQNAESFQLGAASTITAARWWGTDGDQARFVVRLFPNLAADPDQFDTLAGTLTKTPTNLVDGSAPPGHPIFEYELTLAQPLKLGAGSRYLSVLMNDVPCDPASTVPCQDWGWLEGVAGDGVSAFRGQSGVPWDVAEPDLSLQILGTRDGQAPEPATLLLVAIGGLAATRGRRALAKA